MKLNTFFSLFLCVVAISVAIPIPAPGNQKPAPLNTDKGKTKALPPSGQSSPESPSPPGSGSHTPTPSEDSDVPLPGRSGVHLDKKKNVATMFVGNDQLPGHAAHVEQNQATHPENARPKSLASDAQHAQNRKDALRGIPSGVKHPVTGEPLVRDEKPLAMFDSPNHGKTTTVQYLPKSESNREGGLASTLQSTMKDNGAKGQLRSNPGFLPPNPNQRIAHEAPARLNTQTKRPSDPNATAPKKPKPVPDPKIKEAEEKRKAAGYTPSTEGGMSLRHRPGKDAPPPPVKKDAGTPANSITGTNLVPGAQLPAGQRWKPNNNGASHAGAPPPNKDSETRNPPRPQNIDAHRNQPKPQPPVTPPAANLNPGPKSTEDKHNTDTFKANLDKFTKQNPVAKPPPKDSSGHEAPAKLQSTPPAPAPAQQNLALRPAPPPKAPAPKGGSTSNTGASSSKPAAAAKAPKPKKGRN